jgi:Rrf2 family protein
VFSQTVEYALRAAVHLAMNPALPQRTEEIATATEVPAPYLAKVLRELNRHDLVASQRGLGGGISLAKSPTEITILEIVNAVDPVQRIKTCPLKLASHGTRLCSLHRRMDDALAMVEAAFGETTLAEILDDSQQNIPLCERITNGGDNEPLALG